MSSAGPKRLLALDVGEARIGLAYGERGSSFAFGRGFLKRTSLKEDIAAIQDAMHEHGAEGLVIGLPRRTDGKDSKQTQRVRAFAKALSEAGLELVFEDERFTTQIATEGMLQSGLKQKKRRDKGRIDEASAILILESYLRRCSHLQTG